MKSLKEFIFEQKDKYSDIFDRCENIQGECKISEAKAIIKQMKKYFTSRNYYTVDIKHFNSDSQSGDFYLIFDDNNYLMCFWDFNTYISSTVQIDKDKAYVNGNLFYDKNEIINFIENHLSKNYNVFSVN